jgi:hypothetical protein
MRALLLIVALSFCGQAWSEQPQQVQKAAKEKQVKAAEQSQPTSKVIAPSLKSQPISDGIVSDVIQPVNANNEQSTNDKPEKNWLERFETDPVATFTGLLFFATLALWLSTRDLVNDAKDTAKRQLRAYVSIEKIFFKKSSASPLASTTDKLNIIVKNYGQSPAYRMTIRCEPSFNSNQPGKNFEFSELLVDEQMLHPSQDFTVLVKKDPAFGFQAANFYVFGRMVYHDIHGEWWITDVCYRYRKGRFMPHGDQNYERGPYKDCPE